MFSLNITVPLFDPSTLLLLLASTLDIATYPDTVLPNEILILPSSSYYPPPSTNGMHLSVVLLELKRKIDAHPLPRIYKEANRVVSCY